MSSVLQWKIFWKCHNRIMKLWNYKEIWPLNLIRSITHRFQYLYWQYWRIKGKVKVKLSLCLTKHHAMKAYWESGGIAPLILWPQH
jgi:hypothetical protein